MEGGSPFYIKHLSDTLQTNALRVFLCETEKVKLNRELDRRTLEMVYTPSFFDEVIEFYQVLQNYVE